VVNSLEKSFKLSSRDVIFGATHLFLYSLRDQSLPTKKQPEMQKPIGILLEEIIGENMLAKKGFVDLTITFVDPDLKDKADEETKVDSPDQQGEKILLNIPQVRIILKQ